jgi:hypothetical protein
MGGGGGYTSTEEESNQYCERLAFSILRAEERKLNIQHCLWQKKKLPTVCGILTEIHKHHHLQTYAVLIL